MTGSPGKLLRESARESTLQVPGAFNALVGRMIERAGYKAAYLSGGAFSAGALGVPDVGLFTLTELAQQTARLARRVNIPVIVDADTGFGGPVQVERTVQELENAGAAALQLEDQPFAKRCGHLSGKALIDADEMCGKLRAAAAARQDKNLVILARTDARGVTNINDAIERAKQYLDAGADWIFPEALADAGEFEQFAKAVKAPLVANMTEFGKSALLPFATFEQLGYAAVLYPVTLLRVAMKAVDEALAEIAAQGTQAGLLSRMQSRQELYDLIEYKEYEARDRAYFSGPNEQ
ncbi:MAG: methylisocitrate lyase [Pirellulales bacterium]